MEDTHIAHIDLIKGIHLFGVFDGHGGEEYFLFLKWYPYLNDLLSLIFKIRPLSSSVCSETYGKWAS